MSRSFIQAFDFLNIDLLSFTRTGCVVNVNWYTDWTAMMALPFLILSLLIVLYLIPVLFFYLIKDRNRSIGS